MLYVNALCVWFNIMDMCSTSSQAGGYKAPFVAVGICLLVSAVPCTLLIRKIGKLHDS